MSSYDDQSFTAVVDCAQSLAETVLRYLPPDEPLRVLDLGCGTGHTVLELARARPRARFVGLDISEPNITEAKRRTAADSVGEQITFIAADYMSYAEEPFDLIYTESVLHLIGAPTDELASKLAVDLRRDGLLLSITPFDCTHNRALVAMRRCLRGMRGPWLDAAILGLARTVYGSWPEDMLRERMSYMYVVPERLEGPEFRRLVAERGLVAVESAPWPSTSIAKLKHRLAVFRKKRDS